jgi:hypothetical protein
MGGEGEGGGARNPVAVANRRNSLEKVAGLCRIIIGLSCTYSK